MNILTTSKDFQELSFIPRSNVIKAFEDRVVLDGGEYIFNPCFKPIELILRADGLAIENKNFENRVYEDGGSYLQNTCFDSFIGDEKVYSESLIYKVSLTYSNQTVTIRDVFNLDEGKYYTYEVSGQDLMYRGKIFCTDQTGFDKYVINSGDFIEATAQDDEFITA